MASMSIGLIPSTSPPCKRFSTFCCKNHVLLSFADVDNCRNDFVDSLYKELTLKGIHTIRDTGANQDRSRSLETDQLFTHAVDESRFLVVVLSENYVSSVQCLDVLSKIVDRSETTGQAVVPIFYNMDPSDFRNRTGAVAEAWLNYEETVMQDTKKVQKWRESLSKVAYLCGWDSRKWEERILIKQIVADISDRLIYVSSSQTSDYVGMGCHIIELEEMLCLNEPNYVRMVGVWGMGGIGKSTIARIIYDRLCSQFEVHCFLENVKENFKKHGAAALQQQILPEKRKINRWSLNASLNVRKRRLSHRKVLLVLDDVDDWRQLEALAGEPEWFGQGSRIIITTRDKHLLDAHGVKDVYEVKYLNTDQALHLFSKHAFKENNPMIEYLELSQRFISYAKGLPLALTVLGSYLNDISLHEWQIVRDKLAAIPDIKVNDVLRISFDGLDDTQKEVFLDIACFFNGGNVNLARDILEGCGLFPDIAFAVLEDRALITISNAVTVEMHDLLQEMGHEIVRLESDEPGERSRLWNPEDIHQVLTKNKGTKTVEGICLDMTKTTEMELDSNVFARMNRLRFLNFYFSGPTIRWDERVHLPNGLLSLSGGLRYLRWYRFPVKSLPSNFCAENLVRLIMPNSNIQQLWSGVQNLVNLKEINLLECECLTTIPDLSHSKNMEIIILQGCKSLIELHSSIQNLNKLKKLDLSHCGNLRSLPERVDSTFLETFSLASCSQVKKCPEIFGNFSEIDLSRTALTELPPSIQNSTVANLLDLTGCSNMSIFPEISVNIKCLYIGGSMEELPVSIHLLSGLQKLKIDSKKLLSLPSSIWKLKSLNILDLSGCTNLEFIAEILEPVKDLTDLYLRRTAIKELPSMIENLEALSTLLLDDCAQLVRLPTTIHQLSQLLDIDISNCRSLSSLPQFPHSLKTLNANNCYSLQILTPSECRSESLHFANCFKLSEKGDSQSVIQLMATKFCEDIEDARILFPGSEIPEWLHDKRDGSLVKTQLPSNWHRLKGVVLCVVFGIEELESWPGYLSLADYWIRCKCYVQAGENDKDVIWDWSWFEVDLDLVKSDHVLVWFNRSVRSSQTSDGDQENMLSKFSGSEVIFELYFEGSSEILKHFNFTVKKCGVTMLCDDDDDAIINSNFAPNQEEEEHQNKRLKYSY